MKWFVSMTLVILVAVSAVVITDKSCVSTLGEFGLNKVCFNKPTQQ